VYAEAFGERDAGIFDFVKHLAELVDGNPRQIKRYVNLFRFYGTLRHSLLVDGYVVNEIMPPIRAVARFVELSVMWPHAVDCLRVRDCASADGRPVSRLEFLEVESAKISGDDAAADKAWKKIVGGDGLGLGAWAEARAFRTFLSKGEPLGKRIGHGLW